jgi:superfamily II DNA or RNA helicase
MQLKLEARELWARVSGELSDLWAVTEYLNHWARGLDPKGKGREVYLWEGDDLRVLGGALVAIAQEGAISACFEPLVDGVGLLDKVQALLDVKLPRDYRVRQYQAVSAGRVIMAPAGRCLVDMAMGGGKTLVATAIAALGASYGHPRWLYLVKNKELAAQSKKTFREMLQPMCDAVGADGAELVSTTYAGVEKLTDRVFDGTVVDECQDLPPPTRARGYALAKPFWRVGLSGTPLDRQDAGNALVIGLLGPVIHRVSLEELTENGYLAPGRVQPVIWDRGSRRLALAT